MRIQPNFSRLAPALLCGGLLLVAGACSGSDDEPQVEPPTPKLNVVVFATEDPAATDVPAPTAAFTAVPPASPTPVPTAAPAATVGMGVSAAAAPVLTQTDFEKYVTHRPADVNPLTGQKADDPALLRRRPLMVRIGNDPIARPQVALNDADMVYEEITEWWVTRFTAIYLSRDPEMIAPVRSARLVNLMLSPQYGGALASSGGSDGVRWELSQSDIVDLDQLFVPDPYFYRNNEGWATRLAFNARQARDYLQTEGLDSDPDLRGFYFTEQIDESGLPAGVLADAREAVIPFPKTTSQATWRFDPAGGKYLRFTVGEPHTDANGGQVAASNVIIYFADHQATDIVEDSNGATSIRVMINGRGAAWLLRDGKILKGNWETDGTTPPNFVFDNGQPMPLKPGNSWVQLIPLEYFVTIDGQDETSQPELMGVDKVEAATAVPVEAPTPTLTPIGARSN